MAMEQSGSGWPFPVVVDKAGGSLPMTTYEQDVAQAIHIILFTAKGNA